MFMKATGIVRKTDSLGRVVIPKELRKLLGFDVKQELEVFVDDNGIIIRKYEKTCIFCSTDADLVHYDGKIICKTCINSIGQFGTISAQQPTIITEKSG